MRMTDGYRVSLADVGRVRHASRYVQEVEYRWGRLKLVEMLEAEFILSPMNTHQVLAILVIYTRVLGCVADSLQERRFSSISPTDYKDTKARIFHSEFIDGI